MSNKKSEQIQEEVVTKPQRAKAPQSHKGEEEKDYFFGNLDTEKQYPLNINDKPNYVVRQSEFSRLETNTAVSVEDPSSVVIQVYTPQDYDWLIEGGHLKQFKVTVLNDPSL